MNIRKDPDAYLMQQALFLLDHFLDPHSKDNCSGISVFELTKEGTQVQSGDADQDIDGSGQPGQIAKEESD